MPGASQLFQTVQFEAMTLGRTTTSTLCALQAGRSRLPSSLDFVSLKAYGSDKVPSFGVLLPLLLLATEAKLHLAFESTGENQVTPQAARNPGHTPASHPEALSTLKGRWIS